MSNDNSTQPCGCDPGLRNYKGVHIGYKCERHRDEKESLMDHTASEKYPNQYVPSPRTCSPIDGIGVPDMPYLGGTVAGMNAAPAPTRASTFAPDSAGRKAQPVASGVLDYFPDALIAIAEVSKAGNDQHNPGQPLHWNRSKSTDEADALLRHFLERGSRDSDGMRHSAKMAWRALALLQKEIEAERYPVKTESEPDYRHRLQAQRQAQEAIGYGKLGQGVVFQNTVSGSDLRLHGITEYGTYTITVERVR